MRPEDLRAHLARSSVDLREDAARRIVSHVVGRGLPGLPTSRPVSRRVERAIEELLDRRPVEVLERAEDPADGFVKYLFRMPDGALAEAVRIPLEAAGRYTVCLSSQAGCAMACSFCATGRLGLARSLHAWEMVAQFLAVRDEAPGRVTGAVFQGQGEPLSNYDAVTRAAEILSHPCGGGVRAKAITISTVGVVPGILRMAAERRRERLIVSLTSAVEERRRELLPVAARWSLPELADAVRTYQSALGRRVTLAWVLLRGINTGADEVEAISRLFAGVPILVNLVEVNDARPDGFRPPAPAELAELRDRLRALGVPVVRRYSGGAARHAACGMLASIRNGTAGG
jgi:23S rRNA (adenine2503-C2)-methyltransferase